MGCKEIKLVRPKGNQSWMFIGRTHAEAEAPILWSPEELTHWKGPWRWDRQEEKGTTEEEMVGGITDSMDVSLSKLWGMVKDWEAWRATVHGVAKT